MLFYVLVQFPIIHSLPEKLKIFKADFVETSHIYFTDNKTSHHKTSKTISEAFPNYIRSNNLHNIKQIQYNKKMC